MPRRLAQLICYANKFQRTQKTPANFRIKHTLLKQEKEMEEAQAIADNHKRWIVEFLKNKEDMKSTCKELFDYAHNEKHCDSLAALLLSLKRGKVIAYDGMFLSDQSPNVVITLINPEWTPNSVKKELTNPLKKLV